MIKVGLVVLFFAFVALAVVTGGVSRENQKLRQYIERSFGQTETALAIANGFRREAVMCEAAMQQMGERR